jgi:D-alanine-D-alanine ligase-like ATP-grasp enzyme
VVRLSDSDGRWRPHAISPEPGCNPEVGVAFFVLHGIFGEDGHDPNRPTLIALLNKYSAREC